jgi:hypothetical protein
MKLKIKCDWCGKEFERLECQTRGKKHLFCSRQCLADFSSKTKNPNGYDTLKDFTKISEHLSELNRQLNPNRMTLETRAKIRNSRLGTGEGKTYEKTYGRHTHRVMAEQILDRPLKKGEVVHHIDFDKRNNTPENLRVFKNQAEHAAFHAELKDVFENWLEIKIGGDAR